MKPLKILLYGDCYNDRFSQGINYMSFLEPYGQVILITPLNATPALMEYGDVLCLPGGADVDPWRYNERPVAMCGRSNSQYEHMDREFLPQWIATGKPIIGICRGLQTLNVALGGSLIQHMTGHSGNSEKRHLGHHMVFTEYADIDGSDYRIYPTNSYHHQAVKKLAPGLEVLGWSHIFKNCPSLKIKNIENDIYLGTRFKKAKNGDIKPDIDGEKYKLGAGNPQYMKSKKYWGVVEIMRHTQKPYIAFQYHPEDFNCPLAHHLIEKTL